MLRDQVMDLVSDQGLPVSRKEQNLLPIPAVGHIRNNDEPIEDYLGRRQDYLDGKTKGMPGASLGVAVRMELLGTPRTSSKNGSTPKQVEAGAPKARLEDQVALLPTPTTRDFKDGQASYEREGKVQTDTVGRAVMNSGEIIGITWGKYEPAVRRWEETLGRLAPAPTNPDGKDGAHRLAAEFVEWMMGLPEGWVTDPEIGLKRNDQLKALGNGVVPQQAEMALQLLIDKEIIEKLGK